MDRGVGWKKRIADEVFEYLTNFAYLALFFCVFISYRRLLMAEYHITYGDYGVSLIKALILAKLIMIGDMMRLGERLHNKPLIVTTLYKTMVFTLWVVLFRVIEVMLEGLLRGKGAMAGLKELLGGQMYETFGFALIVFFAFLPFFAFRELERVLGKGAVRRLFFSRGASGTETASQVSPADK